MAWIRNRASVLTGRRISVRAMHDHYNTDSIGSNTGKFIIREWRIFLYTPNLTGSKSTMAVFRRLSFVSSFYERWTHYADSKRRYLFNSVIQRNILKTRALNKENALTTTSITQFCYELIF
jgi:hypothetical protein